MVSKTIIIGVVAGAIIAGVGWFVYNGLTGDDPYSQLQRSRLGLGKPPSIYDLYKDTPEVKKLEKQWAEGWKNLRNPNLVRDNQTGLWVLPKTNTTNTTSNAAYYIPSLAMQEEQYEPWALR